MTSTAPCVCTALRKASRAVSRIYDERLSDSGMTINQFAVLRHISREPRIPLSRLADLLVMERTSLYRVLAPLERQGWVVIESAGPRVKIVSITDAGLAAMGRATGAWETTQNEILGAVGISDFRMMEAQLRKLVAVSSEMAS
ncbi:hypothetical protein BH09PSE3_BH09PSE3_28020 [soil metagenome]